MAVTACKYHAKVPARWECLECDISFCSSCIKQDIARNTVTCPLCNNPAAQVSAGNFIVPFWNRIPKFFTYPANLTALIFIILIAIGNFVFQFGGILGIGFRLFLLLVFVKYAMAVLVHTSRGHLEPPDVTFEMITENFMLPVKLFLLLIAMFLSIGWVSYNLGDFFAILWAIFILAGLPASVIVLAIDGGLFRAMNPILIFNVMRKTGMPYLLLYIFLLLVAGGNSAIGDILEDSDSFMLLATNSIAGLYFVLIMFNMMGYLLFQYHEDLGYNIDMHVGRNFESQQTNKNISSSPIMNEVDVLVKEGRLDDAVKVIHGKISHDINNLELHARYHILLQRTGNDTLLAKHGQEYINILLFHNQPARAANIFRECLKANPEIAPGDPDNIYEMAYTLYGMRAFREAFTLINGFHKRYPRHQDIPKIYLLMAKLLCEELQEEQQAMKVIKFLQGHYPGHELNDEINQYGQFVRNMMKHA